MVTPIHAPVQIQLNHALPTAHIPSQLRTLLTKNVLHHRLEMEIATNAMNCYLQEWELTVCLIYLTISTSSTTTTLGPQLQ